MSYFETGTSHACPAGTMARAAIAPGLNALLQKRVEERLKMDAETPPLRSGPEWPTVCDEHGASDGSDRREAEAKRAGDVDADIKNPTHYNRYKIEPIAFIEENGIPYSEGNVIKYVCRWRHKDGIRDLKKAREYIDKIIRREEAAGE